MGLSDLTTNQESQLRKVLTEFATVFQEPKGLPQSKEVDDKIPIKFGVNPINVRYLLQELSGQVALIPTIMHVRTAE